MNELHRIYSDDIFLEKFENLNLEPQFFTHEAHLRLAYLYLLDNPRTAAEKLCAGILRFDIRFSKGDKFHKTITIASAAILKHFMDRQTSVGFLALLNEFPVLRNNFKGLLLSHYSVELIQSESGQNQYIKPDLQMDPVFDFIAPESEFN